MEINTNSNPFFEINGEFIYIDTNSLIEENEKMDHSPYCKLTMCCNGCYSHTRNDSCEELCYFPICINGENMHPHSSACRQACRLSDCPNTIDQGGIHLHDDKCSYVCNYPLCTNENDYDLHTRRKSCKPICVYKNCPLSDKHIFNINKCKNICAYANCPVSVKTHIITRNCKSKIKLNE